MTPIRRRIFIVNLHAPGCGRTTTHESLAGALGIPDFIPPIRRRTFIVKEAIIKSLNNSICYGAFTKNGQQVGFARVITDYATHFCICDVVVKKEFRNKGRQLLKTITGFKTIVRNADNRKCRKIL